MKIATETLINNLVEDTRIILNEAEKMKEIPLSKLNWKENAESWSILECLEHLNLYGDFYLPEIENRLKSPTTPDTIFKSGFIGNYFAKSMLPKKKLNKMKTFKDKNPAGSKLGIEIIERFVKQQHKLLDLLNQSRKVNLNKVKTSISISTLLKIKLGDTFRFLIAHNQRHIEQALRNVY